MNDYINKALNLEESQTLEEATTSRLVNKFLNDDISFAIISAFRSENTDKENNTRAHGLKQDVRKAGFGYNEFIGRWVEDGNASDEDSLLITDIDEKTAFKLGQKYGQSSIIYKDVTGVREICTTSFTDGSKTYSPGDIVRNYSIDPRHPLNTQLAKEIFGGKVEGPASQLKKGSNKKPFNFKVNESFELYEKCLINTRLGFSETRINLGEKYNGN